MRVAYVIPGSGGGFYCENCTRDSALTSTLKLSGFEMLRIPMYLPLFAHDGAASDEIPIFYGAVSLYLKQRFRFLRRMPRRLERLLDSRPLLGLAANMAGSTRAAGLEEMTISMLLGGEGDQKADLERMANWLADGRRPDVIHLSNALLLGLAGPLKERFNAPVVCTLQDEHTWIEPMMKANRERVWNLLHEKAADIDRFISVSAWYKKEMARSMRVDESRIAVIPPGVDPEAYACRSAVPAAPVIGFLSRIDRASGLDTLIEALGTLVFRYGLKETRLVAYGGMTGDDGPFVRRIKRQIARSGLRGHVSLSTAYDRRRRFDMLAGLSVLCVPRREPEAFGFFLLEALASGVPVVQPALGAFPEIVGATGGGLLYSPDDGSALAEALREVLSNPERAAALAAAGCAAVRRDFSVAGAALRMAELYRSLAKP